MNTIWGISGLFHDAAVSVIQDNKIVFASSAERYSRTKNDKHLNSALIDDCLSYGMPNNIAWYENPYKKMLRSFFIDKKITKYNPSSYISGFNLTAKISLVDHHKSHLYSSLFTAPFNTNNTLGVVLDSVGEFATISIWDIQNFKRIKRLYTQYYPNSLGLFYSAITDLVGLKPLEDEYILMGMASYATTDKYYKFFKEKFFYKNNLIFDCRYGCRGIFSKKEIHHNRFNIALGAQLVFEEILNNLIDSFLQKTKYKKVIYAGGCALNCRANSLILDRVEDMWIYPNPGDAGASLGAALALTQMPIRIDNMFTGYDAGNITNINEIVDILSKDFIVGVINGRAEFGPRALGNRSILADPRNKDVQSMVNRIKGRELFRPFAPAVLKQHCEKYFKTKTNLDNYKFMQYTAQCIQPEKIPGAVHVDGTSRIQVVDESTPFLYKVLLCWYEKTGIPVLLNTSLNYRGKPLINKIDEIDEIKNRKIKIVTSAGCR
jgi:carbamoyltransferase